MIADAVPRVQGLTVLVAEDGAGVQRCTHQALATMRFTVLGAKDGPTALVIGAAYPRSIDLLVADVIMPGFGGWELARRLAKFSADLKVLFMSAYSEPVLRHLLPAGAILLSKPFTAPELHRKVWQALSR